MKILIKAIVCYPVYINQELEVSGDDTQAVKEAVLTEADRQFESSTITPIIHDSESHPDIVD